MTKNSSIKALLFPGFLFVAFCFLAVPVSAQDSYGYGMPPGVEQLTPREQEQMMQMMQKMQESDFGSIENEAEMQQKMMDMVMDMAESQPPRCKDLEEEKLIAQRNLSQDLADRKDFDRWISVAETSTNRKVDQREYKNMWDKCMAAASSDLADIICHTQMINYYNSESFNPSNYDMGELENITGISKERYQKMGDKYQASCKDADAAVNKALKVDTPRRGDSLLITEHGSFLLGERDGLIFGNYFHDMTGRKAPYFKKVK